jgi:hypothetical protein
MRLYLAQRSSPGTHQPPTDYSITYDLIAPQILCILIPINGVGSAHARPLGFAKKALAGPRSGGLQGRNAA